MVRNEDRLNCNRKSTQVPVSLGNLQFFLDVYILPISSGKIVLRIQWLKTLGPILIDLLHDYHAIQTAWPWRKSERENRRLDRGNTLLSSKEDATNPIDVFYNLWLSNVGTNWNLIFYNFLLFSHLYCSNMFFFKKLSHYLQ